MPYTAFSCLDVKFLGQKFGYLLIDGPYLLPQKDILQKLLLKVTVYSFKFNLHDGTSRRLVRFSGKGEDGCVLTTDECRSEKISADQAPRGATKSCRLKVLAPLPFIPGARGKRLLSQRETRCLLQCALELERLSLENCSSIMLCAHIRQPSSLLKALIKGTALLIIWVATWLHITLRLRLVVK